MGAKKNVRRGYANETELKKKQKMIERILCKAAASGEREKKVKERDKERK